MNDQSEIIMSTEILKELDEIDDIDEIDLSECDE